MNYKFCSHCGKKIDANAMFCPHCGAKQSSQMNQAQQPNYQQAQPNYSQQNYTKAPNQQVRFNNNYNYNSHTGYRQKIQITPPPCNMKQAWLSFWHQYSKGHGYSSRSEYWLFFVDNILITMVLIILGAIFYAITPALGYLMMFVAVCYGLAIIIPSVSLECRRLRDAGVSNGWVITLVIMNFIPYLNFFSGIATFIFSVMPSVRYSN